MWSLTKSGTTSVFADTASKHVDQYFEADQAAEALEKWQLLNNKVLSSIVSFVRIQNMDLINYWRRPDVFWFTSVVASFKKNAALAAEAKHEHRAPDSTSSESCFEESCRSCRSSRARHRTCSRTRRIRNNKSSVSYFPRSINDINAVRKARRIRRLRRLCHFELDSIPSSLRARYET